MSLYVLSGALVLLAGAIGYVWYVLYDRLGWLAYSVGSLAEAYTMCDSCIEEAHGMGLHTGMEEN